LSDCPSWDRNVLGPIPGRCQKLNVCLYIFPTIKLCIILYYVFDCRVGFYNCYFTALCKPCAAIWQRVCYCAELRMLCSYDDLCYIIFTLPCGRYCAHNPAFVLQYYYRVSLFGIIIWYYYYCGASTPYDQLFAILAANIILPKSRKAAAVYSKTETCTLTNAIMSTPPSHLDVLSDAQLIRRRHIPASYPGNLWRQAIGCGRLSSGND